MSFLIIGSPKSGKTTIGKKLFDETLGYISLIDESKSFKKFSKRYIVISQFLNVPDYYIDNSDYVLISKKLCGAILYFDTSLNGYELDVYEFLIFKNPLKYLPMKYPLRKDTYYIRDNKDVIKYKIDASLKLTPLTSFYDLVWEAEGNNIFDPNVGLRCETVKGRLNKERYFIVWILRMQLELPRDMVYEVCSLHKCAWIVYLPKGPA